MKRSREDDASAPSAGISEASVGIAAFRSEAVEPAHPTGIFAMRWADFHVREISGTDGLPLALTDVPKDGSSVPQSEVISFVMYKENRTTADALMQLAGASGCPFGAFAVAGSKDRRAVTVQQVTARGLRDPARLLRINEKWTSSGSRVRVGHFATASRPLDLSSARGNRFVVVLREVELIDSHEKPEANEPGIAAPERPHDELLRAACEAMARHVSVRGFVNYFGMQRFGQSAAAPTHLVGAALLGRDFVGALQLILSPHAPGLKPGARTALQLFADDVTCAEQAKARLPGRGCEQAHRLLHGFIQAMSAAATHSSSSAAASALDAPEQECAVRALKCVPRRQLLLYMNALQAFAFNRAATCRLTRLDAEAPVAGDLIWAEDHSSADGSDPLSEGADALADESDPSAAAATAGAPYGRAALPPAVRALSAAEASSGRYSIRDVLLPLPGHAVEYPSHEVAEEYARALGEFGIEKHGDESGPWYFPELFDLPGCYRPLVTIPSDMSAELRSYTDHTLPLEPLDVDLIQERQATAQPTEPPAHAAITQAATQPSDGKCARWAWVLRFTLPASAYASMLLREALHEPIESDEHTRRAKAALFSGREGGAKGTRAPPAV